MIQPEASYRGAKNQLYRVEIHTGSVEQDGTSNTAMPTFKWSRENGSVIFPIAGPVTSANGKTTVTLAHFGYDDKLA